MSMLVYHVRAPMTVMATIPAPKPISRKAYGVANKPTPTMALNSIKDAPKELHEDKEG